MEQDTHAIVIGGSMAGLLAARVLSDHFTHVTIVERDPLRNTLEARKGQPQVRHLHALLGSGSQLLERFFPGLLDELSAGGAVVTDAGEAMRWYCLGGYRTRLTYGRKTVLASRTFLERCIRQRVASLPAVSFRDGCAVEGLAASPDRARITGVYLRPPGGEPELLQADLVIDASGRGAAAPRWLETLGYQAPPEQSVRVNVGYATQTLRRDPDDPVGNFWYFITPEAPAERRIGAVLPVDGERWIVTLGGWFGDHPPTDEAGFLSFARSLSAPDVADLIARCEPLDAIIPHRFPSSLWRHYEQLSSFPEGFLVLGDAICSFNPIYGQGMTSAAMQADVLDQILRGRAQGQWRGIARPYFQRVARVIAIPWQLAVGEDFRWPEAEGVKPAGAALVHRYTDMINRASHYDPVVGRAFLDVLNLLKPPTSLFAPKILLRAMHYGRRRTPASVVPVQV
jgi:2-polyprenyl-6-methoxyphenol hydroxylase-like FAD-dependent oxidoreductase